MGDIEKFLESQSQKFVEELCIALKIHNGTIKSIAEKVSENLNIFNRVKLVELAEYLGIKGCSNKCKDDLILLIQ